MLLERQAPLEALAEAHRLAASDGGRTVLVSGEAGIGKTSLIEAFAAALPEGRDVYWGGCEALFAARPLGPLFDIAEHLGGQLHDMLRTDAASHKVFAQFQSLIESPKMAGSVFVIEDIHWADNATMDFLKYAGRRIAHSRCLIVATYRDDEVGPNHPLKFVIGDLPSADTTRIHLSSLSAQAIAALAECDERRAGEICKVTGGNPFYVHELLSSASHGVPGTVTDAILAKASRLEPDARRMLNLVSVVPGKCEYAIIEAAFPNALELVDACDAQGLLRSDRGFVSFRHEIARLAIEDALPAGQRQKWNAHVLAELLAGMPDALARLAHHADMAGDRDAVLQYAPLAAEQAARLGAHREAVAQYRQALQRLESDDERRRGELSSRLAYELYVTGKIDDAIATHKRCLELWEKTGEELQTARTLRWLSRLHWFSGKRDEADRYADLALAASEPYGRSSEYAMACSNRAQLYMLSSEGDRAVEWANRAIGIAESVGDVETLAHALNNRGTALCRSSCDVGRPDLLRSLELAQENEFQEHVARAYTNLGSIMVGAKLYAEASTYLAAGIDYTSERDLDSWLYYMQGWRARLRLETGDWAGATEDVAAVTRNYGGVALIGSPAITTLALLRLRRGDPDFQAALDEAFDIVAGTHELQRFAPLVAARAESDWLAGVEPQDVDQLSATLAWAVRLGDRWSAGDLGWWMHKLGIAAELPGDLPEPHDLLLRQGDWSGAARTWERLGAPYHAALALAEGDVAARREALQIFSGLGALPAAAKLRRELRAAGVKDLPKAARQSTRRNAAGLTNRQLDVLRALCAGLSDAEIARRLFISTRTVGHHVSAILGKLEVHSRTEAAVRAVELGIDDEK